MSPNSFITEPERTQEYKQGFHEGYQAGKAALRRELQDLIKSLPNKQISTETSSTYCNYKNL